MGSWPNDAHHCPNTAVTNLQSFEIPFQEFLGAYNKLLFGLSLLRFADSLDNVYKPLLPYRKKVHRAISHKRAGLLSKLSC